jgi:hypothetical protein
MSSTAGPSPRYAIRDAVEDLPLAVAADVHDFFVGGHVSGPAAAADLDEWTFTVSGFTPVPPLPPLGGGDAGSASLGYIKIQVLGGDGVPLGGYTAWDAELTRIGPDLHRLTCATAILPDRDAESVWELWRSGGPARTNLWTEVPVGRREGWLQVVALNAFATGSANNVASPVGEIELDGSNIVDMASLYLAFGEAVNGPGGYFGWNLDALRDCLDGGWGATAKPKIRWRDFAVAQRNLTETRETLNGVESVLDIALSVIRRSGADLDLR